MPTIYPPVAAYVNCLPTKTMLDLTEPVATAYHGPRVAALCRDAAHLLETRGWCQKKSYDHMTGAFCLSGAIAALVWPPGVDRLVGYRD